LKKKLRKRKGEIPDHAIMVLLAIVTFFTIIIASMQYIQAADKYLTANRIARKYMLKMESYTHGYLSQDDATQLEEDFENNGFTNIDLTGSTFNEVDNGGDIYLDIKYCETIKELQIKGFSIQFVNVTENCEIQDSSTSKN
jgi:hypothetical protein